jgi:hypothetical protein
MTTQDAIRILTDMLVAAGHTVDCTNQNMVDGVRVLFWAADEYDRSSYLSKKNGKVRLYVDGNGDRKSYPQTKDGEFNWAKILETLESRVKVAKAAQEQARKLESRLNRVGIEVDQLKNQYGMTVAAPRAVSIHATEGGVQLRANGLTKAQAAALLAKAQELGMI